jgi:hypothetical protein
VKEIWIRDYFEGGDEVPWVLMDAGGTLLVFHSLLWIFKSCREFCEEGCCIRVIEMKEGILFMENFDMYCISFLLFTFCFCFDFLEVRVHNVV